MRPKAAVELEAAVEQEAAEELEDITVTTRVNSNIRTDADGMGDIFAVIPSGESFKVLGIEGDWVKTEYKGKEGYTYKTNVTGLPEDEAEETAEAQEIPKKVTIFTTKWVHTQPGENVYLTSQLEGFDDCEEIIYQWMCDKGNGFEEAPNGSNATYSFVADDDNLRWGWKLTVFYK